MAFDIMSIFSGQQPPAPPAEAPQNPPTSDPVQQAAQGGDGAQAPTNQNPAEPATSDAPASPLDVYNEMFKNDDKADADQVDPNAPLFEIDPEKMQAAVSKLNFVEAEGMQDLAARALNGDTQAFMEVLNTVGRQAYSRAAQLSGHLADKTARAARESSDKSIPDVVRNIMTKQHTSELNPVFKHPAMEPMVDALRTQFQRRMPDAAPSEIAGYVNKYLTDISSELSKKETADPTDRRIADDRSQDFSDFFS